MVLTSIELSGFKSFAKKTTLSFLSPTTAIVGPNGSGKSNVVEAIRFVLGEQSIKSLRGRGGADMIFKGSKNLSALSRASVSITFDNRDKRFRFPEGGDRTVRLDFDELTVTREVFADGANKYKINGTDVRLKDIVELFSSVNIGSSGHHIISQGEADRVLTANPKERRVMIEDALGLRVYQYRIKESEKKLEKTEANMKEVASIRREIAPHISFLKKQVEKIERGRELREEVTGLYQEYFGYESQYLRLERRRLEKEMQNITEELRLIDRDLSKIVIEAETSHLSPLHEEIRHAEIERSKHRTTREELSRRLGRLEGSIELLERAINKAHQQDTVNVPQTVFFADVARLARDVDTLLTEALAAPSLFASHEVVGRARAVVHSFIERATVTNATVPPNTKNEEAELSQLRGLCESLNTEIAELDRISLELEDVIATKNTLIKEQESRMRTSEREHYELKAKKQEIESRLTLHQREVEQLQTLQSAFEFELGEAGSLIGLPATRFNELSFDGDMHSLRTLQQERRRKIERIKIKIEDLGAAGTDVLKEYEESVERDLFLARELEDLNKSIDELNSLIEELKQTLDVEFKKGIETINREFQRFFSLMFGGGTALLAVSLESKKTKEEEEIDAQEIERGIEIHVSLPHKKVRDLHMLSGGERSLTSIALLFAMSQVNPPPFLVLDETDAALDEANSKRYGDMIDTLSKVSQLIVVTHNRETMSRAQVLYGVTIGADGGSKLLSIKFDEAAQMAK